MPLVTLRVKPGVSSPGDLTAEVKDNTLEYLLTSDAPTIRVSAYLERDWPEVAARYAELDLGQPCSFESRITGVTPGSRVRKGIQLPGAMQKGEQLTLEVKRTNLNPPADELSEPTDSA